MPFFVFQLLNQYENDLLPECDVTYARVARISNRLLKANVDVKGIYDKTWTISVIDRDDRNAFVLPVSSIYKIYIGRFE